MAKVGPGGTGVGAGDRINFKSVIYNQSMCYRNGAFIIADPGLYEITITLLNDYDYNLAAYLRVNRKRGFAYGQVGGRYQTLSISTIVNLSRLDHVDFSIETGKVAGSNEANNFAIRKIKPTLN